jgi:hypothetical protein
MWAQGRCVILLFMLSAFSVGTKSSAGGERLAEIDG